MTREAWVEGGQFCKRYATPQAAQWAVERSLAARAAGVQTPAVLAQRDAKVVSFDRITAQGQPTLPQMVGSVAALWGVSDTGLAPFDPFRRIRPRLPDAPQPVVGLCARLEAQDKAQGWPVVSTVHGDFHPGQVLRDAAGRVWLIDLDDMALAPPEADLGNLAAWLATQVPCDLKAQAAQTQAQLLALAAQASPDLVAHFCAIALVRRALKLAKRGQPWALEQLALSA